MRLRFGRLREEIVQIREVKAHSGRFLRWHVRRATDPSAKRSSKSGMDGRVGATSTVGEGSCTTAGAATVFSWVGPGSGTLRRHRDEHSVWLKPRYGARVHNAVGVSAGQRHGLDQNALEGLPGFFVCRCRFSWFDVGLIGGFHRCHRSLHLGTKRSRGKRGDRGVHLGLVGRLSLAQNTGEDGCGGGIDVTVVLEDVVETTVSNASASGWGCAWSVRGPVALCWQDWQSTTSPPSPRYRWLLLAKAAGPCKVQNQVQRGHDYGKRSHQRGRSSETGREGRVPRRCLNRPASYAFSSAVKGQFGGSYRVFHQHGDGHRPYATWHR